MVKNENEIKFSIFKLSSGFHMFIYIYLNILK